MTAVSLTGRYRLTDVWAKKGDVIGPFEEGTLYLYGGKGVGWDPEKEGADYGFVVLTLAVPYAD